MKCSPTPLSQMSGAQRRVRVLAGIRHLQGRLLGFGVDLRGRILLMDDPIRERHPHEMFINWRKIDAMPSSRDGQGLLILLALPIAQQLCSWSTSLGGQGLTYDFMSGYVLAGSDSPEASIPLAKLLVTGLDPTGRWVGFLKRFGRAFAEIEQMQVENSEDLEQFWELSGDLFPELSADCGAAPNCSPTPAMGGN